MIQSLWKTVWRFLKKLEIELPYDPAIPLLGIYFGHLMQRIDSLEKTDAGRDWGQQENETVDDMAGWHH